jgi:chemotaxis protein methyltransferase CheR
VAYAHKLELEPAEHARFLATFTINVSQFFRDEKPFAVLQDEVLPALLEERRALRTWSAGCAGGAEGFSLAMLLEEQRSAGHYELATDVDESALARARAGGPYSDAEIANVSEDRGKRFLRQDEEGWWVAPELRSRVTFAQHDLLRDPYKDDFDLVLCRNVVIYLTRSAKDRIFQGLARALRPGGFLFIGSTEMIFAPQELDLERHGIGFYQRRGAT